jgi:hypothetical protein
MRPKVIDEVLRLWSAAQQRSAMGVVREIRRAIG